MNLLIFLTTTITFASASSSYLRHLNTDSANCVTECASRIEENTLTEENIADVCVDAHLNFEKDIDECTTGMTNSLGLSNDERVNRFCEYMCNDTVYA
mmetsp:Transcript_13857/g.21414  ORF Transcript_13857/g.21414 Transcript_13857/m.21414 type:complete len:98 (-) Transcript_13857:160-453(-)